MNIPQKLSDLQTLIRSVTDRLLFLALLTTRDRKRPSVIRLLALAVVAALLMQVVMQSGMGVWNWADDGVRLMLAGLVALHLTLPVSGSLLLACVLILAMCVSGARAARVANTRLLMVMDEVEQLEAEG